MIKISLLTGTPWVKSIITSGDLHSDIGQCIDDFVSRYGVEALPVTAYELGDLEEDEVEQYLPINGGEYYIQGICDVTLVTDLDAAKEMVNVGFSDVRREIMVFDKYNDKMIFSILDEDDAYNFYQCNAEKVIHDNLTEILDLMDRLYG